MQLVMGFLFTHEALLDIAQGFALSLRGHAAGFADYIGRYRAVAGSRSITEGMDSLPRRPPGPLVARRRRGLQTSRNPPSTDRAGFVILLAH
jgi:hypothetical protein